MRQTQPLFYKEQVYFMPKPCEGRQRSGKSQRPVNRPKEWEIAQSGPESLKLLVVCNLLLNALVF